jgi:hypothetical protein
MVNGNKDLWEQWLIENKIEEVASNKLRLILKIQMLQLLTQIIKMETIYKSN